MIAILEYGIGNVSSIQNMLRKIGVHATISSNVDEIEQADKLILPGVGRFDYCMSQLRKSSFFEIMEKKVLGDRTPILGVCAGSQMLFERSEEGAGTGLGWIKGEVIKFQRDKMPNNYKVPHMGWTDVQPMQNNILYAGIEEPRFYFTHSYHIVCSNESDITATAEYGYSIVASVQNENIFGVQFHPEKSHHFGMKLYSNFSKL